MLSSNWHVTLKLTIFEAFTIKWPKFWMFLESLKSTAPAVAQSSDEQGMLMNVLLAENFSQGSVTAVCR